MSKILLTAAAVVAVSGLSGAAYGGFVVGGYWKGAQMEKAALAHDCASLDPKTLAFGWKLPISMDIAMDALPDVAPVRKPYKAGAK